MFARGIYLIWDLPAANGIEPRAFFAACGPDLPVAVQFRAKGQNAKPDLLRALTLACNDRNIPLIINDRADWWGRGCAGLHLGQADGPAPSDRGAIGRSTHTLEQVAAADADPAVDHLGFGPVAATNSKVGALPARGLQALAAACLASGKPVVAIGGLDLASVPAVRRAGAHAMAVIGAVFAAPDPAAACAELVRTWAADG
jgi:thiamine-phosphate pyrophosphorylase